MRIWASFIFLIFFAGQAAYASVDPQELKKALSEKLSHVPEFAFIATEAQKLGVNVYLFGGAASAFGHYVRWDLMRKAGDGSFLEASFDYDLENIYRAGQDLDIVIDGATEDADKIKAAIENKYPYKSRDKSLWEVRLLKSEYGVKPSLLNNPDFLHQHTDTASTGLIQLTPTESRTLFDLRDWENPSSLFSKDLLEGKITYLFSDKHSSTQRYKDGMNPPILSVVRYLAKVIQYNLQTRKEDLDLIRSLISKASHENLSDYAVFKLNEFSLKIISNAFDLEKAFHLLESTGLKAWLLKMDKNKIDQGPPNPSLSWWLNKKPLPSFPVGEGEGKTAQELGIDLVAHETSDFSSYQKISSGVTDTANVFTSRKNQQDEGAYFGEGFYTLVGTQGSAGKHMGIQIGGFTLHFQLDPLAREGIDFKLFRQEIVLVLNRNALKLSKENTDISFEQLAELLKNGQLTESDQGFIFKVHQKLQRRKSEIDLEKVHQIFQDFYNNRYKLKLKTDVLMGLFSSPFLTDHPEMAFKLLTNKFYKGLLLPILQLPHWQNHPETLKIIDFQIEEKAFLDEIVPVVIKHSLLTLDEKKRLLLKIYQYNDAYSFNLRHVASLDYGNDFSLALLERMFMNDFNYHHGFLPLFALGKPQIFEDPRIIDVFNKFLFKKSLGSFSIDSYIALIFESGGQHLAKNPRALEFLISFVTPDFPRFKTTLESKVLNRSYWKNHPDLKKYISWWDRFGDITYDKLLKTLKTKGVHADWKNYSTLQPTCSLIL